ncbi:hypothetical protein FJY84_01310 [Candidatus Bathyarchaeota archaeon]|nr:hypothetical protein [Candidatus Bathyarchaeota archaeon]
MSPISIYPHYLQFSEDEEKILQDCLKVTNSGIKRTIILALKNYHEQLINSPESGSKDDELAEIKNILYNLSTHLEENNGLIKKALDI